MPLELSFSQTVIVGLLFVWTGFVRTGLGFGGAALGLPLLLFVDNQPLIWLPIIGFHLLFFSGLTLRTRLSNIDWAYLKQSSRFIMPSAVVGVFGLVNLPNQWLLAFIYSVSLFYGFTWMMSWAIESRRDWFDKIMLVVGGYVAGTSLTGAPLMVAVYMRHVSKEKLRDTLFILWFILVAIKMSTFAVLGVDLRLLSALWLLPSAAIGHVLGLKAHDSLVKNDQMFKRVVGGGLVLVSALGLWNIG